MKIGVVSLQGDFEKHGRVLARLGAPYIYVSRADQLNEVDGLILPGGESTTMLRLLDSEKLLDPLAQFALDRPVFGTCAGCILMANEVTSPAQRSLGLLDISVERNAYGRQVRSSIRRLEPEAAFLERTAPGELEAVFIRAPMIRRAGKEVTVLAADGPDPVLVEEGRHMASTFHPELTGDVRVHQLFVDKVLSNSLAPSRS